MSRCITKRIAKKVRDTCYNKLSNKIVIKRENHIQCQGAVLKRCDINIRGMNNLITIESGCRLNNCSIQIYGDNTVVNIGKNVVANEMTIWCEDKNNSIYIGKDTTFHGKIHIACIEGTSVSIGEDCMFSSDIHIVTGDSHTITNEKGKRINTSQDIVIKNHVWVGQKNIILKGVHIEDNSIIGAGSIVTKQFLKKMLLLWEIQLR